MASVAGADSSSPSSAPPDFTLDRLAILASIAGELARAERLRGLAAQLRHAGITSDDQILPFLSRASAMDATDRRELEAIAASPGWVLLESVAMELPPDLRWLLDTGAVTFEELGLLHSRFDVLSAADIVAAFERGTFRDPDFRPAAAADVAAALLHARRAAPQVPLGRAVDLAHRLRTMIEADPAVERALVVGSLRRGQELVRDIELVAASPHDPTLIDEIAAADGVERISHKSARRLVFSMAGAPISIRWTPPSVVESSLLLLTGSGTHLQRLRELATSLGLRLGPDGLERQSDGQVLARREEDVYRELDLPFIAPELREGGQEIDLARQGRLPRIVSRQDIRGDLHMHTNRSDGRDTVDAMADAAMALGYEYIAITDHSPSSNASRSLMLSEVKEQAEEIAAARRRFPRLRILHGCEVDILPDGSLDFEDRVLRRFDLVLASLHSQADHSPTELLHRYLLAMTHPDVAIITHPANRLFPRRPGYGLDFPKVFEAAVRTHTALEIDGAPSHLDLSAPLARQAAAAGAMLTLDSDAHRAESLDRHMELALLLARQAWVEPRHVLNTRPWAHVKGWLAAKRRRFH